MRMDVAVAKVLFEKKYYLVLNDEYYIKINRSRYYQLRKYIKEKKMPIKVNEEDRVFLSHIKKGKLHPLTTKCYQDLLKKQKALALIKEKGVDVDWLIYNFKFGSLDDYNCDFGLYKEDNWRILTQEEYNFLKEVLL